MNLANQMKGCGEKIIEQMITKKIMRTLIPIFNYIVVAIKESKKIQVMKVEELRLIQRGAVKPTKQALQA